MLNEDRLKAKLKAAMNEQAEEEDAEAASDRICAAMAKAIIEEIKELKITYSSGLTAPNGAVAGTFNHTVS